MWEGDKQTSISNFNFMGVQHRPDFEIRIRDTVIAIEVKRGETGQAIRDGLGQALVYSQKYDFVIYLFIDKSKGKALRKATTKSKEKALLDSLWKHHNIRFAIA